MLVTESTQGPVCLKLKSRTLQKQFYLEVWSEDKLRSVATLLNSLRKKDEFEELKEIVFKETPEGPPLPHYLSLAALLTPKSDNIELYVEIEDLKKQKLFKTQDCCEIY